MNKHQNSETAEVAPSAASETQNSTVEVKAQESGTNITDPSDEGKFHQVAAATTPPSDGEAATGAEGLAQVLAMPVRVLSDIQYVPVEDLTPHPLNETIYGHDLDEAFVDNIKNNGVYQPLLITKDRTIIAGHRRHAAAKQLSLLTVPAVLFHSDDELEIRSALVETNQQRVKTNEMFGKEFNVLVEVEEARAAARMEAGKPVTQAEKGKARDIAAAKLGKISGVSAERAGAVVEVIDKLIKSNKTKEKAEELRAVLNKNIAGARKKAIEAGYIKIEPKKIDAKKAAAGKKAAATKKKNAKADAPKASGARAGVDDGAKADAGLQAACDAETFLGTKAARNLSDSQKNEWKKVVGSMVKLLTSLGVKISVRGGRS